MFGDEMANAKSAQRVGNLRVELSEFVG